MHSTCRQELQDGVSVAVAALFVEAVSVSSPVEDIADVSDGFKGSALLQFEKYILVRQS